MSCPLAAMAQGWAAGLRALLEPGPDPFANLCALAELALEVRLSMGPP